MRVKFVEPNDPFTIAARMLQAQSHDGCFSSAEIVRTIGVSMQEVRSHLEQLASCHLVHQVEGEAQDHSDEYARWVLNKLIGLTPGREHDVQGIEGDDYRILNDLNEPVLYPPQLFQVVEANRPEFWGAVVGEDGELYAYPAEWSAPGFFEDFFTTTLRHGRDSGMCFDGTIQELRNASTELYANSSETDDKSSAWNWFI